MEVKSVNMHEFLLLFVNLAQVKQQNRVVDLFCQAWNAHDLPMELDYSSEPVAGKTCEPIATNKNAFGFFVLRKQPDPAVDEIMPLVRNLIKLLAVILENLQRENLLEKERVELEKTVEVRVAEIKQGEQALRESEEKFRALYENAPLPYQSLDAAGCFLDVNPAWLRTLGYDREEVIGKWFGDFLHPDFIQHFETNFPAFKKRGYVNGVQYKIRRKDGTYRHIEFEGCIGYLPDGSFRQTYCVFQDITERKKTEKDLKENHKLLEGVVDNIPDMFWMKDPDGKYLLCNREFEKLVTSPREQIVGQTDYDLFPKEKADFYCEHDQLAIQNGTTTTNEESADYTADGYSIWVETLKTPIYNSHNELVGIMGLARDISQRKNALEQSREHEEFLNRILDNSPIPMWIASPNGTLLRANQALYKSLNVTPEQVIGKYNLFEDQNLKIPEITAQLQMLIQNREQITFEALWRADEAGSGDFSEANNRWIYASIYPLTDPEGNIAHLVCQWMDVTDLRNLENELLQFKWLLEKEQGVSQTSVQPAYTDMTELNQDGLILSSVGTSQLQNMTCSIMDLLDSCLAVYERNGNYAYGTFVSTWCGTLDNASRKLCGTGDNPDALQSGQWLCHESCWAISKEAIDSGKPVDRACCGGIRIYAVPIHSDGEIVGAINFGYGPPPDNPTALAELSENYQLPLDQLQRMRNSYRPRPPFIIDVAKHQLDAVAQLIGETVTSRRKEDELAQQRGELERRVDARTEELRKTVNLMAGREVRMAELKQEIADLKAQLKQADSEERS